LGYLEVIGGCGEDKMRTMDGKGLRGMARGWRREGICEEGRGEGMVREEGTGTTCWTMQVLRLLRILIASFAVLRLYWKGSKTHRKQNM
jgi:hypothetical protein